MAATMKLLGRANIVGTAGVQTIYTLPSSTTTIVKLIIVCNNTGSISTFSLWHDPAGTTSNNTTVLFNDSRLAANQTKSIDTNLYMNTSGAKIYGDNYGGSGHDITISIYGIELT